MIRPFAPVALASLFAAPALAEPDMTLIVNRTADAAELFIATQADRIAPLLGMPMDWMTGPDGTVDFADLRYGTFDQADTLFSRVETTVDGEPEVFEAMSLMVHPEDTALPFVTPLDAMLAIAVCTADDPATPPTLSELQAYFGYYAYKVSAFEEISVDFPATGRGDLTVAVLDYTDGGLTASYTLDLGDGAQLVLPAAAPDTGFWGYLTSLF